MDVGMSSARRAIRRRKRQAEARLRAKRAATASGTSHTSEMEAERDAITRDLREPQLRFIFGD